MSVHPNHIKSSKNAIEWIETRPVPLDFDGPVDIPFERFEDAWLDMPLIARFEAQASRRPDKIAIDDGQIRLTYAQARRAVHKLAAEIDAVAPPGAVIVAVLASTAAFPITILATLASGRPLIPIDVAYPAARKAAILKESGLGALLIAEGVEIEDGLVSPAAPRIVVHLAVDQEVELPAPRPSPNGVAGVSFTSGSTGRPKGVAYGGRAFLSSVSDFTNACHIDAADRILSLASLSVGGIHDALTALYNGATVRMCNMASAGLAEVLRIMGEERITVLSFVPSVMRMLMQLDGAAQAFRTLRILSLHGDRTLASDVELYRSKLPASCFIHVSLGSMEAATIVFGFVPPAVAPDAATVSPGYPASGKSILVLDEDGRPAEIGEEGELVVRSRNIALGAWQDGQMVQGPFLADPQNPERRIFHTRDIVRIHADGSLHYIGRRDRRIKIRGLRADPADVEAALRSYPGIADVTVISRSLGEDAVFVAYATATPDCPAPTSAALRNRLYEDIPDHMVPVEIIFLDAIPRLPNFKPDLQYLARYDRERTAEIMDAMPAPGPDAGSDAMSPSKIFTAVEKAWCIVLGRPSYAAGQRWDISGGNSLNALRLILSIEESLGHRIPLEVLARDSTPQTLADAIVMSWLGTLKADRSQPVMFLLPGIGGDEPSLAEFRRGLSPDIRFEPIEYPGLDSPSAEIADFEKIACSALDQILAKAPSGPVHIAGYSMGGIVAVDVARRLRDRGRDPAFVAALDTWLVRDASDADPLNAYLRAAPESGPVWFLQSAIAVFLIRIRRFDLLRNLIRFGKRSRGAHRGLTLQKLLLSTLRRQAIDTVNPLSYGGSVTLFMTDRGDGHAGPADCGWGTVSGDIRVVELQGDHWSMLLEPYREANAAAFLRVFKETIARRGQHGDLSARI